MEARRRTCIAGWSVRALLLAAGAVAWIVALGVCGYLQWPFGAKPL